MFVQILIGLAMIDVSMVGIIYIIADAIKFVYFSEKGDRR